ncbi:MAG TPA: helix-turn-helix domain-containing protein [Luteimonas sp.]|nr:helix-turn-helix domain-containing protein [Luteimonas sp.]
MFRAHGRIAVRSKGEGTLTLTQRIRLSRRHGSLSQAALADLVGVHRSAVSHWESTKPKKPNIGHLLAIAVACGVQFEWLATGRGSMLLSEQAQQDMTPAAHALMVEDEQELELLRAYRETTPQSRMVLVELAQQLARQRLGRRVARPTTLMHALRTRIGDDDPVGV